MPIARITSHGLITIALLVATLWGCILAENSILRSAQLTRLETMSELRMMKSGLHNTNAPVCQYCTASHSIG